MLAVAAGNVHMATNYWTVAAVGWNKHNQCNGSDCRDIVAIYAGWRRTVGVKSDGTVVAVGRNHEGQCNAGEWRDIVGVAAG